LLPLFPAIRVCRFALVLGVAMGADRGKVRN